MLYILLIVLFLIYYYYYYEQYNFYKTLHLPLTHYTLNWFEGNNNNNNNELDDSIYKLVVFKSLSNDYMLILEPQNIHLFIEDANVIIYHPLGDIENHHYACPEAYYEFAYAINEIPKITCHRPLDYLKSFVFTEKIYVKQFNDVQNPLDVVYNFFTTIQKMEGVNALLRRQE